MVRTRAKHIWKLRIQLQPSRCLPIMLWMALNRFGNCVLKINRPDGHPLGPNVRPSGRQCLTVRTWLSNKKDFQRKSQKLWSHSCPSGRLMSTVRTGSVLIIAVAHLNPQPINRCPWALRTARIRYWIPSELRELFCEVIGADLFSLKPLQMCCCYAITEFYLRGRL
jgi:hypothetical protein